jgi:hypothetical protein
MAGGACGAVWEVVVAVVQVGVGIAAAGVGVVGHAVAVEDTPACNAPDTTVLVAAASTRPTAVVKARTARARACVGSFR